VAGVVASPTGADADIAAVPDLRQIGAPELCRDRAAVLRLAEARFAGEAVAAVVAGDRYAAEDAAALVVVDAEPLPAAVDVVGARGGPVVHAGAADNVLLSRRFESVRWRRHWRDPPW